MILAGDVGGTKVRLALFDEKGNAFREERFASRDFADFNSILKQFLKRDEQVISACLGIAGPVLKRQCKATNLPWEISADELEKSCGIPRVNLINDLEANAWGLKALKPDEFFTVNRGVSIEGNQALVSAGTGLGEAGLYWNGSTHNPFACEGGHCDFGPTSEEEIDLLLYLKNLYGHVSYERVISGQGLYDLYRFLIDTKRETENPDTKRKMESEDPPKVITERGVSRKCTVCMRACHLFVSLYGSESGNVALKFLAVGGVFLGGGIAPRLVSFFKEDTFMKAFLNKGRFARLLSNIPVKIVLNDKAALLGAFRYAEEKK